MSRQDEALALVRRGYSVVPVGANKRPVGTWKRWQTERADETEVRAWQRRLSPPGWAVVTGSVSGLVVADFDGAAGLALLEGWRLTPTYRTPRGAHVHIAHPGDRVRSRNALRPGLDLKADGASVVVIGQGREAAGGPVYTMGTLHPELRELIEERRDDGSRPAPLALPAGHVPEGAADVLERAVDKVERDREPCNPVGLWLATQLRDRRYDEGDAFATLVEFWRRVSWHGRDDAYRRDELEPTVASAYSRPPRDLPRGNAAAELAEMVGAPLEEVTGAAPAGGGQEAAKAAPSLLGVTRASSVTPRAMRYIRAPWLPAKLAGLEGQPKTGKSNITADQAAAVTSGRGWPDPEGPTGPPGNVLVLSAEDDPADTIVPRLVAAGADLNRVYLLGRHEDSAEAGRLILKDIDGNAATLTLPGDLQRLADTIGHHRAELVILDPLFAFLGEEVKTNVDSSVRALLLSPLAAIAAHHGACVECVRHWTKGSTGNTNPLEMGGGSIGITGAYRALAAVAEVDAERVFPFGFAGQGGPTELDEAADVLAGITSQGPYVLAQVAANAQARGSTPSWAYYITGPRDSPGASRIRWHGTTQLSAVDLVRPPDRRQESPAQDEAVAFLEKRLADGPVPAGEVKAEAAAQSISDRTLERVKARLGVAVEQVRNADGKVTGWVWRLP